MRASAHPFAVLVSLFLLVEGTWELNSPVVFGLFTSNPIHGVIHLGLGFVGLLAARGGHAAGYLGFLGGLLLLVGTLWFIPATRAVTEDTLNLNRAVAICNLALGAVSLVLATDSGRQQHPLHHPPVRPVL